MINRTMNRYRLLEIGPYPPPESGWAVRIKYVVEQLRKDGVLCSVLNLGENRKVQSPNYICVNSGWDYIGKLLFFASKGYNFHMHANGDSPKGFILSLIALSIGKVFKRKTVLTFHAGPDQKYFPRKNSLLLTPVFCLLFFLSDKIICNSDNVKKNIIVYGVSNQKIKPIPAFSLQYLDGIEGELPADLEKFLADREPIITSYILFRPEFYHESVLKCIQVLVNQYPKTGVVVTGGMPEESDGGEGVRSMVKDLGIESNVYFAGNLKHEEFLSLLKRSKLYLRSHARDGVCSSVLEAMALKIPVVANSDGIRPKGVIEYEINNAVDMANKTSLVLEKPPEVSKFVPIRKDTVKMEVDLLKSLNKKTSIRGNHEKTTQD